MRTQRLVATALLLAVLPACTREDASNGGGPSTATPPVETVASPTGSPTPPALPDEPPPTRGGVATDCVNGWVMPHEGSPRFLQPLGVIRRTTGVEGPLEVVDMRFFEGPESPPSEQGYLLLVQRWYVKLYAPQDPSFQGRFLVEARRFGRGVAAVAPYDTSGFRSPDWIGFQYDSADPELRAYEGLPGVWAGEPYDFVRGEPDGEDARLTIPGLPDAVVGCLDAT